MRDCIPGSLWSIGSHRLIVGDAREGATYARLMAGERASALWTDPPYGVSYEGKTPSRMRIEGDGTLQAPRLAREAFAAADEWLTPGAALFVATPSGPLQLRFGEAIEAAGWSLRQQLVWVKNHFALGRQDFHNKHEPVWYGRKPGEGRWGRGHQGWQGGNARHTVTEAKKPLRNGIHPTMKPVALIAGHLECVARGGDVVLDPFAGSGSTLLACEALGLRGRGIEISPEYAAGTLGRLEAEGLPVERIG